MKKALALLMSLTISIGLLSACAPGVEFLLQFFIPEFQSITPVFSRAALCPGGRCRVVYLYSQQI